MKHSCGPWNSIGLDCPGAALPKKVGSPRGRDEAGIPDPMEAPGHLRTMEAISAMGFDIALGLLKEMALAFAPKEAKVFEVLPSPAEVGRAVMGGPSAIRDLALATAASAAVVAAGARFGPNAERIVSGLLRGGVQSGLSALRGRGGYVFNAKRQLAIVMNQGLREFGGAAASGGGGGGSQVTTQ